MNENNAIDAEVVDKITKKTEKEKTQDNVASIIMPIIIILIFVIIASVALKIFFWALPALILIYVGWFLYRKFIK